MKNILKVVGAVGDQIIDDLNQSGLDDGRTINGFVSNFVTVIMFIVGMVATVMIIMGGVQYMTSQGDAGKTKKAKDTILYGIIGMVIAVLAFAIVNFVLVNVL